MKITHEEQQRKWDEEHSNPYALKQMDVSIPSVAVPPFLEFIEKKGLSDLSALEMGCGKGRNILWLAGQSQFSRLSGFDFSQVAIEEAKRRTQELNLSSKVSLEVMDATAPWSYASDSFDIGIDCTASVDIETPEGRQYAVGEMRRVLKEGGYFLVYVMSTDDEYHKEMIAQSPAEEPNAFIHPQTGKFEKVFAAEELNELYKDFTLIEERRIPKVTEFFGKSYQCLLHWRIYQK